MYGGDGLIQGDVRRAIVRRTVLSDFDPYLQPGSVQSAKKNLFLHGYVVQTFKGCLE